MEPSKSFSPKESKSESPVLRKKNGTNGQMRQKSKSTPAVDAEMVLALAAVNSYFYYVIFYIIHFIKFFVRE